MDDQGWVINESGTRKRVGMITQSRKAQDKKVGMTAREIGDFLMTVPEYARIKVQNGFRQQIISITAVWDNEEVQGI